MVVSWDWARLLLRWRQAVCVRAPSGARMRGNAQGASCRSQAAQRRAPDGVRLELNISEVAFGVPTNEPESDFIIPPIVDGLPVFACAHAPRTQRATHRAHTAPVKRTAARRAAAPRACTGGARTAQGTCFASCGRSRFFRTSHSPLIESPARIAGDRGVAAPFSASRAAPA